MNDRVEAFDASLQLMVTMMATIVVDEKKTKEASSNSDVVWLTDR